MSFQDLDATVKAMLDDADAAALPELRAADKSFETPERGYSPAQATLNLYLFEVNENRELREPAPIMEFNAGQYIRKMPPLRVDCHYLVTAWSDKQSAQRVQDEHQLLGEALLWLSSFSTIPASYYVGSLRTPRQPFPPPTLVAQADGNKRAVDFWTGLGIAPRASFSLIVTIAMELMVKPQIWPPVVTRQVKFGGEDTFDTQQIGPGGEEVFEIGGTIRNNAAAPISNAAVTVREMSRTVQTDADGRFKILGLSAGNYNLDVTASGFQPGQKAIVVPRDAAHSYDVNLAP